MTFLQQVDKVKELEPKAFEKILDEPLSLDILNFVSNNLHFRNQDIDKDEIRRIATTEYWKLLCEIDLSNKDDETEIKKLLSQSLRYKVLGFIVKEKELTYSKETNYTCKIKKEELNNQVIPIEGPDLMQDSLEDIILNLNVPSIVKTAGILRICYDWDYSRIGKLFGHCGNQGRVITMRAINIIKNLVDPNLFIRRGIVNVA